MGKIHKHIVSRALLAAVCAAVALQCLIPIGTMPTAVGDGWIARICPDGLPTRFVAQLDGHEHAHHHHGSTGASDAPAAMESCELGSSLHPAVDLADLFFEPFQALRTAPSFARLNTKLYLTSTTLYRNRSPPHA